MKPKRIANRDFCILIKSQISNWLLCFKVARDKQWASDRISNDFSAMGRTAHDTPQAFGPMTSSSRHRNADASVGGDSQVACIASVDLDFTVRRR
jgi:hypothetical protein